MYAEQKEEEVKILERSVEELECTINVLEKKVSSLGVLSLYLTHEHQWSASINILAVLQSNFLHANIWPSMPFIGKRGIRAVIDVFWLLVSIPKIVPSLRYMR